MPIAGIQQPEVLQIDENLRLCRFHGIVPEALGWYQDPEVVYLVDGVKVPYTVEKLDRMYSYLDKHGELYYIQVRCGEGFRPIGDVTFWQTDMPIVIGDAGCRGRGIGRRVIQALAERAAELGYPRIWVNEIYNYNRASRQCFESVGFRVIEQTEESVKLMLSLWEDDVEGNA